MIVCVVRGSNVDSGILAWTTGVGAHSAHYYVQREPREKSRGYDGPYIVEEVIEGGMRALCDQNGIPIGIVSVMRLRPFGWFRLSNEAARTMEEEGHALVSAFYAKNEDQDYDKEDYECDYYLGT